jgi:AhpD family alkylhydroperoxidase
LITPIKESTMPEQHPTKAKSGNHWGGKVAFYGNQARIAAFESGSGVFRAHRARRDASRIVRNESWRISMPTPSPIEYADASPIVRAVFDDIKATRNVPDVNNFWKYLARDEALLKRTWESVKEVMQPGALDALTKELIYVAVSVTNGCNYCIASHTAGARKAGMTEAMFGELMAVVGMANETNRLANGYRVQVDAAFEQ